MRMLLFLFLFCPLIAGACSQEDGVFAYVVNRNGVQPGSGVPEYKYEVVASVYQKLVEARGDFRMPAPELVMNDGQLYVAWMNSKKGLVGLEEKAYDICTSFGADSLNALAALLAHELTHYYEKHNWTRHFSRNNANTQAGEQLANVEEGLKLEVQSDYLGGFLALSAGFRAYGIIPRLLPEIYKGYILPEEIPGYPSLSDRVTFANNAMEQLQKLQLAFDVANYLAVVEAYEPAYDYYRFILRDFQSRELYNNLGVLRVLEALKYTSKEDMPYALPLELDLESRLGPGKRGFGDNAEKRAALLEAAIDAFSRAELLDEKYTTAWVNKACAYLLLGEVEDARYWAAKARKQSEKLKLDSEARDARVLLAIIEAMEGNEGEAEALLQPLAEEGNPLARTNLSILRGEGTTAIAVLNFARGVERIDDILLDDYLENPAPELQVEMGGNVICGLQHFDHSEVLIHFADDGKEYAVFQLTGDGYDGATRLGIGPGAPLDEVKEKYTTRASVVNTRQGTYLVYPKEYIIFRFDKQGKVNQWIVFRMKIENEE
ncbi:MAG: hypothetical protein H6560_17875 [Lewinellaceae bacterium]|nr:hypothetical protein [Lewinellaceae bacterium]